MSAECERQESKTQNKKKKNVFICTGALSNTSGPQNKSLQKSKIRHQTLLLKKNISTGVNRFALKKAAHKRLIQNAANKLNIIPPGELLMMPH